MSELEKSILRQSREMLNAVWDNLVKSKNEKYATVEELLWTINYLIYITQSEINKIEEGK